MREREKERMQNLDDYRVKNFGMKIYSDYLKKQEKIMKGQVVMDGRGNGYDEKNCPDCLAVR